MPESADHARRAKEAYAAQDQALADLAMDDPYAAYDELHHVMTRHMARLLRSEERSGAKPSRDVTDRLREYRQTTELVVGLRRDRATNIEADAFFSRLADHLRDVAPRLEECARPVTRVKSRDEDADS